MNTYWKDRLFFSAQFILMVAYIIPVSWGSFATFQMVGLAFVFTGILTSAAAVWQLRHSISPFPSPRATARLIDGGVFKWIRHPIYTGILLAALGYSLYSGSVWKGLLTVALWILFQFKARYEEHLLLNRFDQYSAYMDRTGRFLPKVGR
ncbi:MAG: isoprenylcysteine carboxylmethyltransferase family protein [Cytophagales bacterium]|nr:isoprenylcysteine carboxylmethyltransferase family protein [Cytophagales bacterium]